MEIMNMDNENKEEIEENRLVRKIIYYYANPINAIGSIKDPELDIMEPLENPKTLKIDNSRRCSIELPLKYLRIFRAFNDLRIRVDTQQRFRLDNYHPAHVDDRFPRVSFAYEPIDEQHVPFDITVPMYYINHIVLKYAYKHHLKTFRFSLFSYDMPLLLTAGESWDDDSNLFIVAPRVI